MDLTERVNKELRREAKRAVKLARRLRSMNKERLFSSQNMEFLKNSMVTNTPLPMRVGLLRVEGCAGKMCAKCVRLTKKGVQVQRCVLLNQYLTGECVYHVIHTVTKSGGVYFPNGGFLSPNETVMDIATMWRNEAPEVRVIESDTEEDSSSSSDDESV
jgi:hypothetical protein